MSNLFNNAVTWGAPADSEVFKKITERGNISSIFITARGAMAFPRTETAGIRIPLSSTSMLALYQHKDWWHRPLFINKTGDNQPPRDFTK